MFQSVRNFFRDSFFGKDELLDVVWNQEYRFHVVHENEILTSAELQQLQRIVSECIYVEECYRGDIKENAKVQQVQSLKDVYYKEAKKSSLRIKKLSALQYRLKHKIAAKG